MTCPNCSYKFSTLIIGAFTGPTLII